MALRAVPWMLRKVRSMTMNSRLELAGHLRSYGVSL
jgi:hypothetical protein